MTNPSNAVPFDNSRPVAELTMVEIAEQLDRIGGLLEAERRRESEARAVYEAVAGDVNLKIQTITSYAERLVEQHKKKLNAFDGLFAKTPALPRPSPLGRSATFAKPAGSSPKNLAEAIVSIWTLDRYSEAMTTEEIAEALKDVGYESDAASTSLRSSINQALAKLCKVGRVVKFRADGSQISPKDHTSRARKYLAAIRLPEPV